MFISLHLLYDRREYNISKACWTLLLWRRKLSILVIKKRLALSHDESRPLATAASGIKVAQNVKLRCYLKRLVARCTRTCVQNILLGEREISRSHFEKLLSRTKFDTIWKRAVSAFLRCAATYTSVPPKFLPYFNCSLQECAINHVTLVSWVGLGDLKSILGIVFSVLSQSLHFEHSLAWICWHFMLFSSPPVFYPFLILVYPILLNWN